MASMRQVTAAQGEQLARECAPRALPPPRNAAAPLGCSYREGAGAGAFSRATTASLTHARARRAVALR